VLTALWVSTYLLSLPLLATLDVIGVAPMLLGELPLLCLFLVFSILYKAVPNATVAAKHALFGGFLSAAVFKLAFELFAWFSGHLVYDAIYGVLRCTACVFALALRCLGHCFDRARCLFAPTARRILIKIERIFPEISHVLVFAGVLPIG
jgi:hypothetical protein